MRPPRGFGGFVNVLNADSVFYCLKGNNCLLPARFKPKPDDIGHRRTKKSILQGSFPPGVSVTDSQKNTWKVESEPRAGMF